ncbi:glycosyltransferase family 2 protein [Desulfoferrobacter suflitae]|uniref:glycosyltransferase family 2 protein n=1 Tax=Desulfoferrobacter suflitae TaxID=2865782 RepID=UPI0021647D3B|nr:glycosyltransferase family 2 protein [Desulfoferrobacter suflitae]MCK8603257.1 glycosyltransferase family 2 protein [Desulfoferrobacter suflitae]
MKYSIIIALYNEEENIEPLFARLIPVMQQLGGSTEYWIVDDGSEDAGLRRLEELQKQGTANINILKLSRNFGHHNALCAGMDHAGGDICIMLDGDLQDKPEDIPKLIDQLEAGYDVVYAVRKSRNEPFLRRMLSSAFWYVVNYMTGLHCPHNQAVLRAFRKTVRDELVRLDEAHAFLAGMFAWVGFKQTSVAVSQGVRQSGKSKYQIHSLISQVLNALIGFSEKPLRLISFLGVSLSTVSFCIGFVLVLQKIARDQDLPEWTSVTLAIFFSTGIILLCLGIMAEYLGRLYGQTLQRPKYIVEKKILSDSSCYDR